MTEGYVVYWNEKARAIRNMACRLDPFYGVDVYAASERIIDKLNLPRTLTLTWQPSGRGDEVFILDGQVIAKAVRVTFQPIGAFVPVP